MLTYTTRNRCLASISAITSISTQFLQFYLTINNTVFSSPFCILHTTYLSFPVSPTCKLRALRLGSGEPAGELYVRIACVLIIGVVGDLGRGNKGDLGRGCDGDLGRRIGLPGLSGLRSDGTSLRPMRGEFIGDEVGVFSLGSFSSTCLTTGTGFPVSGLISSTYVRAEPAEEGLSWLFSDLQALSGMCSLSCGLEPLCSILWGTARAGILPSLNSSLYSLR